MIAVLLDLLPLEQHLLFFIKVFIFFTCCFFWIKLLYETMKKRARLRPPYEDE